MNLFNQRKNKSFSYKPKFQDEAGETTNDMSSKWEELKQARKHQKRKGIQLTGWIVILFLIIILWYVLSNYEM